MSLKAQINEDMKAALRAKESARLSAIRMLMAAIKQREVDERIELDDPAVIAVVDKLIKQRRDSASQFDAAGRDDLASAERFEIEVLSVYLPVALSAEEIASAIASAIVETGAATPADMGKVMGLLKPRLAGRCDLGQVSAQVKAALSA